MRNTIIALAALAALSLAASCQKENGPAGKVPGPMTISAVSEGIGTPTKAEMAYKYDVLWKSGDKIYVKGAATGGTFTLTAGAGTTTGTFTQDGTESISGEVEAFYPSTVVEGTSLVWPAVQTNGQVAPMYSKKTLERTGITDPEEFRFSSLGAVLQIVFNTDQENARLKSISIKDGSKTMSGAFSVVEGRANITATDGAGITLDLGEDGVEVGPTPKYFNIAVPAGKYENLTITFTTIEGLSSQMKSTTLPEVVRNTVGKLTLTGKLPPAGALPGEFSVSSTRKVHFAKGNLWYDGDSFRLEANQYDCPTSWDEMNPHVGHFYWDRNAGSVVDRSTFGLSEGRLDVLFTNDSYHTNFETLVPAPNPSFSVFAGSGEVKGMYRTLSHPEWSYLFASRDNASALYKIGVTVCGEENCLVIAPDNFTGTIESSYDAAAWASAEASGLVCLPAGGYRDTGDILESGKGYYWTSTGTETGAVSVKFSYDLDEELKEVKELKTEPEERDCGSLIRLVAEF